MTSKTIVAAYHKAVPDMLSGAVVALQQDYCCQHKDGVLVGSDERNSVSGNIIYASVLAVLYAPLRWPYGASIPHVCLNEHAPTCAVCGCRHSRVRTMLVRRLRSSGGGSSGGGSICWSSDDMAETSSTALAAAMSVR